METSKHRAGGRFINQDPKNVVGRQKRHLMGKMRELRRAKTKKRVLKKPVAVRPVPRPGNRHRRYPCCGRRKERCACDWSEVEARLDSAAWGAFRCRLEQAELKYARDTSDVGVMLGMWTQAGSALHCVLVEEPPDCQSDYVNFMFRVFVLRRYRLEVWQRLVPAIPPIGTPTWPAIRSALKSLFRQDKKVFPHQFRATTLREYLQNGKKKSVAGMSREAREVKTLQLLYQALPRKEIEQYAATACPCTFAAMYDKLKENLNLVVQGVFGDYGLKLMLDLLVLTGAAPQETLSRWPVDCPGYRAALATMFPGLPPAEHLRALYWVHRELRQTWPFEFPESCAQLCWDHRRITGVLDDALA